MDMVRALYHGKGRKNSVLSGTNAFTPNAMFTGRKDILQKLDGTVRDAVNKYIGQTQCRAVITGFGED